MSFNVYDIKNYKIDENYKQSFSNIRNNIDYITAFEYMIKNYNENIVKEICLFLSKFKFATKKQIIDIIKKKHSIDENFSFENLLKYNFLKDFILVKGYVDEVYERNEENTIYAVGPNGINLLIKRFNINIPVWEFTHISRSGEKVIKSIQVVDIYINMLESFKNYNIIPESIGPKQRRSLGDKVDIDFEYTIDDNIKQNFMILIIRDKDLKEGFNRKISKLEHFICDNGKWRYDYTDVNKRPKIIFVCENEDSINLICRKLRGSSLNKDTLVMYTHDKLLKENLITNPISLKRYIKETNTLKEYEILNEKEFK